MLAQLRLKHRKRLGGDYGIRKRVPKGYSSDTKTVSMNFHLGSDMCNLELVSSRTVAGGLEEKIIWADGTITMKYIPILYHVMLY